jgi:hypothetical protein
MVIEPSAQGVRSPAARNTLSTSKVWQDHSRAVPPRSATSVSARALEAALTVARSLAARLVQHSCRGSPAYEDRNVSSAMNLASGRPLDERMSQGQNHGPAGQRETANPELLLRARAARWPSLRIAASFWIADWQSVASKSVHRVFLASCDASYQLHRQLRIRRSRCRYRPPLEGDRGPVLVASETGRIVQLP